MFQNQEISKYLAIMQMKPMDNIQQIADAVQKRSITNSSGERPAK